MQNKKSKKKTTYKPTEQTALFNAFTYANYTVLYLNDYAANMALEVCRNVEKSGYNGNGAKKICRGLENRAKSYFNAFNSCFGQVIDELAEFNANMDDMCDKHIFKLISKIKEEFKKIGIEQYEFLSLVETCRCVCEIACETNDRMCENLKDTCSQINCLKNWKPTGLHYTICELSDFCFYVIPKSIPNLDLNKVPEIIEIVSEFQKSVLDYKNFKRVFRKTYKK